jgi:hypothetical protein
MFDIFRKYKENKAALEKIKNDDYLQRLQNSYYDFSGMSFKSSGFAEKEYLTISEFEKLLYQALERAMKE